MADLLSSALASTVTRITLESRLGPPIQIDNPFGPTPAAAPGSIGLLPLIAPKVTIEVANGGDPIIVQPYADPGDWGVVVTAAAAVALVLVIGFAIKGALR